MLNRDEKNQIYDLLKSVTSIIENAQSRIPDHGDFDEDWEELQAIIRDVDTLYCTISDLD